MASIIKLKRSTTSGAIPADGSLQTGEIAINLADRKLFSSTDGTDVISVSGDRYNLASDGSTTEASITLTVDNEALSNDTISFVGQSGVIVSYYSGNSTIGIDGAGANAYFAEVTRQLEEGKEFFITGAVAGQGNVAFDGTSNVNIVVTQQNDSVTLGTHTTGNYVQSVTSKSGGTGDIIVTGTGEGASVVLELDGTIASNTTGNAATATKWQTSRTITLSGDVSGSVSGVDGSGNITISNMAIQNDSVDLGTHTTGNYVATVSGTANEIEVTGSGSETAAVTIGLPDDVTIGNDLTVTANTDVGADLNVTGDARIGGDAIIDGNLTVEGAVTYISSSTVNVEDTQLKLAANNVADTSDIGVYGLYNDGSTDRYAGWFRDATDGVFKYYDNLTVEPGVTVDDAQASYNLATIEAVIDGGTF